MSGMKPLLSQKGLSHPINGVSSGGSHGPELWSGAMVLRLAVWAGIQGMTPET